MLQKDIGEYVILLDDRYIGHTSRELKYVGYTAGGLGNV